MQQNILLPCKKIWFWLDFHCLKMKIFRAFRGIYFDNFKDFLEAITSLIYSIRSFQISKYQNFKLFLTDFIFRKQKILQTNRIVRLNSGYYETKYYCCRKPSSYLSLNIGVYYKQIAPFTFGYLSHLERRKTSLVVQCQLI